MPDQDLSITDAAETRIPIVAEEALITKRAVATEHVTVRTRSDEEPVLVRDQVSREHVEVTRVPVDQEVAAAPPIRTEGDVTIIPVLEERLVVEKRLFLVEELHLTRSRTSEQVELPTTLRRTHVDIERTNLSEQEEH